MYIRNAKPEDVELLAAVEKACFPPAEAAPLEAFRERVKYYPNGFWLLFEDEKLISFVDGIATDETVLVDEMFADATTHKEDGQWQMIFGVNTLPEYRCQGYAGKAIMACIEDAHAKGRKGVILTCKEEKLHYYAKFGFVNQGVSGSEHGGAKWYQMHIVF